MYQLTTTLSAITSWLWSNQDLEAAKSQFQQFKTEANFSGRNVCLTEAKKHLQSVLREGTSAEKRSATQLDATVDLATVRLWIQQPDLGLPNPSFNNRLVRLHRAEERLQSVRKNGTPAEKQSATQLNVTVDLEIVRLLVMQPAFGVQNLDIEDREATLVGMTKRLLNVLENGVPAEKREADRLNATIDLEMVRSWKLQPNLGLQNPDSYDRNKRLQAMRQRLHNVVDKGTHEQKGEALLLFGRII